ncbi:MAG: hypothetical protein J6W52_02575 [Bacteroidaceae bacterium]|nr:hypothetical protein [Bacteroidaceae bacterium]
MKKIYIATLSFFFIFAIGFCYAESQQTEKCKSLIREYISGGQGNIDVTPLVVGIKDLFSAANAKEKQELMDFIIANISEQLDNNQVSSARSLINIYQMVANHDDEHLPKLYYILGNIYSGQKDTVSLKHTITSLERFAGNSEEYRNYIKNLNDNLLRIRNYKPVSYDIEGLWLTDVAWNSKSTWFNYPKYHVEISNIGGRNQYRIDGSFIASYNNKHFMSGLIFQEGSNYSQIEKEFGEDSLYLFWSSEKLTNADLQSIAARQYMAGAFGTAAAVGVAGGNSDMGSRVTGQLVGGLTEIGLNALFNSLFAPQKRIVIIEAWLKKVSNNMFEGLFSWKESKVGASTTNINFDETIDRVSLMRWNNESEVYFMHYLKPPKDIDRIDYLNEFVYRPPFLYYTYFRDSQNQELRQVYQNWKATKSSERNDYLRNYHQQQIEKLKKWCMNN